MPGGLLITITAPSAARLGEPIPFEWKSPSRIAGRLRLTSGRDRVTFRLERDGTLSEPADQHRVRGRSGQYRIVAWGEHPVGSELVLRFEGVKVWLKVEAHPEG